MVKVIKKKFNIEISVNKNKEIRRWHYQLIGGLVGIITFFVMPGVFKFFGILISLFMFAISLRSDTERFKMSVVMLILCIFCFFSTSFATFDSSEPLAANKYFGYAQTGAEIILVIGGVGIPLLLIIGGIWGFIRGEVEGGVRAIFRALIIAGVGIILCYVFEMLKINTGGTTSFTLDFWNEIVSWIFEAPISLYEGVAGALNDSGLGFDLPTIPQNKHFRQPKEDSGGSTTNIGDIGSFFTGFFASEKTAESPTVSGFIYGVPDAFPLIMGLINIVSIPFFAKKESEEILLAWINHFDKEIETPKKREDKRLPYADFIMVGYSVIILFSGFFIFLAYTNVYGINAREDWRMIVFLYEVIMVFVSVFLLQRYHNYTRAKLFDTLKGTLYGLIGLYMMTRIFLHSEIDDMFSAISMHSNAWYAINTFVFVAPAETLAFCILIPCLVLAGLQYYEGKEPRTDEQKRLAYEISRTQDLLTFKEIELGTKKEQKDTWEFMDKIIPRNKANEEKLLMIRSKIAEIGDEKTKIKEDIAKLNKLKRIKIREKNKLRPEIPLSDIIETPTYLGIFIVGIIGASFLFASAHYMVIMNEISYGLFWAGGLGVIYFSGGFWFIIIGIRYGWIASIQTHALYNTFTILLVILSTA